MRNKEYYRQLLSNTNVVAYLNAISKVESPGYYINFGGGTIIPKGPQHPDTVVCSGRLCSAAFGRYQFMPDTWEGIVRNIGPLDIRNPRDQDIAAIYLLDYRGTLNNVIAGNCLATLDSNSKEWASIPNSRSGFAYNGQGSQYDAKGFCNLVNSLKGTTLPKGPNVSDNAGALQQGDSSSTGGTTNALPGNANFSDIECPPIKDEDLNRANFQITNPGCKISGAVQPITGNSTNGSTVRSSNISNTPRQFSANGQGFGQCSALRNPMRKGDYVVSSNFGPRWGRLHAGIDLAGPIGKPIFAASNGVVEYAGWTDGGYGNLVDILGPNNIITRYAHLDKVKCKTGQQVTAGQQIGDCGTTGGSTGPHLHFEIRLNGGQNPIDPASCMTF